MADWNALKAYIKSNYKTAKEDANSVALIFELEGGRTQLVNVRKTGEIVGSEWAEVATGVCKESDVSAKDALIRNNEMIVGGLAMQKDGTVIFRHSFPLRDFDPNELDTPLHIAVSFGDKLEREFTGRDDF